MKYLLITIVLSLTAFSALAQKPCEELKAEIDAKLKSKEVKTYQLGIALSTQVAGEKVIGSCEGGKKKITYRNSHGNDLIVDFGNGDSIRLVGQGDNFRCDDPAYANVEKEQTTEGALSLCRPVKKSRLKRNSSIQGPSARSVQGLMISNSSESHEPTRQDGLVDLYDPAPSENVAAPLLHAVGVYTSRGRRGGEITVNVSDDTRPIVLALSAYDATHWKVKLAAGVIIEKVILSGYQTQSVSGIAATVPIQTYTYDPSPCGQCVPGNTHFYSYQKPPKELKEITGLDVTSFQGRYEGSEFFISHRVK